MTRMRILTAGVAIVLCGMLAFGGDEKKEDNVETLINKALTDYKAGKVNDAITGLQSAIAIMQKSQQKDIAGFIPKAPAGWKAGEVKSDSAAGVGNESSINYVIVSCKYTKADDENSTLEVKITNSPLLVEPQKQLVESYKDPAVIAAINANSDVKMSMIDRDGWKGWVMAMKEGQATANVVSGATLVMIDSSKGDESLIKAFLDAMDLKGLAAANAAKSTEQPKEQSK